MRIKQLLANNRSHRVNISSSPKSMFSQVSWESVNKQLGLGLLLAFFCIILCVYKHPLLIVNLVLTVFIDIKMFRLGRVSTL